MQTVLLGIVLLTVILLVGRAYVRADPAKMAWLMKRVGGIAALAAATAMFALGRVLLALPLAALGFYLLGRKFPFSWPGSAQDDIWTQTGQRSTVRTKMLEMSLDHDTGLMDGTILSGAFAGGRLSLLSRDDLLALLRECESQDPQGAQLLRAYLERIGAAAAGGQKNARTNPGAMSVEEAYDVLGLQRGASEDDIQQAHRALMKRYHPDQGGSTYLAAKINEAKDVLLRQL